MKTSPVSIIVVNFNGEKYLSTCLNSIFDSLYTNFEVIIVDDGSSDRSVEIIKKFQKVDKRIVLFLNKKNIGAAASRNRAVKKTKGEILVFLDNDTEVTPNWLGELIKPLLKKSDVGGAQALLIDFKERDSIQMAGGFLIPQVAWLAPFNHKDSYSKVKAGLGEREIVAISAALAVKKDIVTRLGGFDEKEGIYTEDLDFSWRIWISGYKIVLSPKSVVYHRSKPVRERVMMKASYSQIYFNLAKNSIRSIIKNYELANILKYLPSTILVNFIRGFFVLVKRRDVSALFGTFSALVWNFLNLTDTILCRLEIQKMRKVPDSSLFLRVFERRSLLEIYKRYFFQTRLLW